MLLKPWQQIRDLKVDETSFELALSVFLQNADKQDKRIVNNIQYYHDCWDAAQARHSSLPCPHIPGGFQVEWFHSTHYHRFHTLPHGFHTLPYGFHDISHGFHNFLYEFHIISQTFYIDSILFNTNSILYTCNIFQKSTY